MSILEISPMLVQYLVGLCCLKWDPEAIDVTIGDMVLDQIAEKERDVDITVTISDSGSITHAFKAYEVKREGKPLDVAEVEQLCMKLLDMPSVTHRAIVSASGFTESAIRKAVHYDINLYSFHQWTRPLQEQFPELMIQGTIEECFSMQTSLLCWVQPSFSIISKEAKGNFLVQSSDNLFNAKGRPHKRFSTFGAYQNELLLRSTETLYVLEPAETILKTFPIPFSSHGDSILSSPAWPHTHTLDLVSDAVYVNTENGICRIDLITITGHLQWQRSRDKANYYIIEQIPSGKAFAGSIISTELRDGQMTAFVFSPKSHEIGVEFIRLAEKHHNAIRNLKVNLPIDSVKAMLD